MNSGIYKLTFKNGATYIGKSNDITRRWKEHAEKMAARKAAAPIQKCFEAYGFPEGDILLNCHTDYLDIAEAYFINVLSPSLNTVRPKMPDSAAALMRSPSIMKYAMGEIVTEFGEKLEELEKVEAELSACINECAEIERASDERTLYHRARRENWVELQQLRVEIEGRKEFMEIIKNRTLWQRIWNHGFGN